MTVGRWKWLLGVGVLCISLGCSAPSWAMSGPSLLDRKLAAMEEKLTEAVADLSASSYLPGNRATLGSAFSAADQKGLQQLLADLRSGKITPREEGGDAAGEDGEEDRSPKLGNMDVGLEGGRYTGYGLSRFALDLSGSLQGVGVQFLMRPEEGLQAQQKTTKTASSPSASKTGRAASFTGSDRLNQRQRSLMPSGLSPDFQQDLQRQLDGETFASGAGSSFASSYEMEGMRLSMDVGRFNLSVLNFHHEPERKKKTFFGNNTTGPYTLGTSSIFPGSARVYVNGKELAAGQYDLDTTRGEIRFDEVITTSDRVAVDYDVLAAQQDQPGNFTGLRLEGTMAGNALGFSHLSQEIVGFERTPDGQLLRRPTTQQIMGFDGGLAFGKQEFTFDVATSSGDRKRGSGAIASAVLTLSDTLSVDQNPDGPYQLPEAALPIIEGSEEVLMDGFRVPTAQYTLDLDQGRLTFQKNAINFVGTEKIEVRYRFREDVANTATHTATGQAVSLGLKGEVGALSYDVGQESTDENFFQFGATGASGKSDKTRQQYALSLGRDHLLKFSTDEASKLIDEVNGVTQTTTNETIDWSLKRETFGLSFQQKEGASSGNTSTSDTQRAFKGNFSPSEKLHTDFLWEDGDNSSASRASQKSRWEVRTGFQPMQGVKTMLAFGQQDQTEDNKGAVTTKGGRMHEWALDYDPSKTFSLHLNQGENPATGQTRGLKLSYQPSQKIKMDYDRTEGESPSVGGGLSQSALLGTRSNKENFQLRWMPRRGVLTQFKMDSQDTRNPDGSTRGNDNTQVMMSYAPGKKFRLTAMRQLKTQLSPQGSDTSTVTSLQSQMKVMNRWDLGLTQTLVDQDRATTGVQSRQWSMTLKAPTQQFIRNLNLQMKLSGQVTDSAVSTSAAAVATHSENSTVEYKLEAEPFWKEHPLQLGWQTQTTSTRGQASTGKDTLRTLMDVPFVHESSLELTHENSNQQQTSGNATSQAYEALLKGSVSNTLNLKGGFRLQATTDATGLERTEKQWSLEGNLVW